MRSIPTILTIGIMAGHIASASDSDGDPAGNLELIREHITPLSRPLGDRLPVLAWQTPKTPTGLELSDVEGVWDTYMERGLMPLCNAMNTVEMAEEHLPILKHLSSNGYPIVVLPLGWVQRVFNILKPGTDQRHLHCPHQAPARVDHHWLPCPSYMMEAPLLPEQAKRAEAVCRVIKDAGLDVRMIMIDYESAAYLRNRADQEERVREALAEALKCPRCVTRFGRERLGSPDGYRPLRRPLHGHVSP